MTKRRFTAILKPKKLLISQFEKEGWFRNYDFAGYNPPQKLEHIVGYFSEYMFEFCLTTIEGTVDEMGVFESGSDDGWEYVREWFVPNTIKIDGEEQ